MRKFIWLLVVCAIFLTGCTGGSYSILSGDLGSSSKSISGNYSKFSGYYYKKVKFSKDDTIQFHYSRSTEKGSLSAKLINSNGKVISKITHNQTIPI